MSDILKALVPVVDALTQIGVAYPMGDPFLLERAIREAQIP